MSNSVQEEAEARAGSDEAEKNHEFEGEHKQEQSRQGQGAGGDCGDKQKEGDLQEGNESGDDENENNMGSSRRSSKRARDVDGNPNIHVAASSSSTSSGISRKKGEVGLQVPSSPPTCYVCKKRFGSWKGVFGHLRAHPRPTPGAFPPPTFTPPHASSASPQNHLHQTLLENMTHHQDSDITAPLPLLPLASSSRRGLDIDLNQPIISVLLDLNYEPPPPQTKDDDHGAHHHKHQDHNI